MLSERDQMCGVEKQLKKAQDMLVGETDLAWEKAEIHSNFSTSLRADNSNSYLNIGTHKHMIGEGKRKEIPKVSKAEICKPFHH